MPKEGHGHLPGGVTPERILEEWDTVEGFFKAGMRLARDLGVSQAALSVVPWTQMSGSVCPDRDGTLTVCPFEVTAMPCYRVGGGTRLAQALGTGSSSMQEQDTGSWGVCLRQKCSGAIGFALAGLTCHGVPPSDDIY